MSTSSIELNSVQKGSDIFTLTVDEDTAVEVVAFTAGEEFDIEEFSVLALETSQRGESCWSRVKAPSGHTLGCVFPVLSLLPESVLDSEDRFIKAFAVNAIRIVLSDTQLRDQFFRLEDVAPSGRITIADALGEGRALAIIDRSQLTRAEMSEREVEEALRLLGFRKLRRLRRLLPLREHERTLNITRLAADLYEYADDFVNVIDEAHGAASNVARFMLLYQGIEILIALVFSSEMDKALAEANNDKDPWKLRDRIIEISGERKRITYIASRYCNQSKLSSDITDLKDACITYLDLHDIDDKADDWSKALYQVRNLVVHRQFKTIRHDEPLGDVCVCLNRVVAKMASEFSTSETSLVERS